MIFLHAIILGIVEGITEFLPISSTGHLILVSHLLSIPTTEFLKTFEIAIQLGAILAVVVLYWRLLIDRFGAIKKIIAAFIPTAIVGFILYKFIKQYLLGSTAVVLWALLIGGVVIILFERWYSKKNPQMQDVAVEDISYRHAVYIGLFQAIAVIPGVSRAGATILGGLSLGIGRKTIVEFSFLLAVPTMLAATALDILKTSSSITSHDWLLLLVGGVVSFVCALFAVKWLLGYIKRHTFTAFGIYRIIVALIFLLLMK